MNKTDLSGVITLLFCALPFMGCSQSEQDKSTNMQSTAMSGVVVDGYLARSIVYVDSNNNSKLEPWEARALTDNDGYFSTAKDGTNYCAATATEAQKVHCLNSFVNAGNKVIIRTHAGYDIDTSTAFVGGMSRQVTIAADGSMSSAVISPITTLLSFMTEAQQNNFATALGVSGVDMLNKDFLNFSDTSLGTSREKLLAVAWQSHRLVDIISSQFNAQFTQFGDNEDLPQETSRYAYDALASALATGQNSVTNNMTLNVDLQQMMVNMEQVLKQDMSDHDVSTTTSMPSTVAVALANHGNEVVNLITGLFNQTTTETQTHARGRALEVVVSKIRENVNDTSIDEAVALAGNTAFLSAMENGFVDVESVKDAVSNGMNTSDSAAISTMVANNTLSGLALIPTNLSGKKLIGTNKAGSKDKGGAVFYFQGASNASSGDLVLCLRYDAAANNEKDTLGAHLKGQWSRLNDYTLLLNITVSTLTKSTLLKSKSFDATTGNRTFVFDYEDKSGEWISNSDFVSLSASETVPGNDAACKDVVPEPL